MIGRTVAHYRILSKIGSGGMGEVYMAEDLSLARKVALKILPSEFAGNVDRRARFTREAKAVAALNHPNIVTVHSVEEAAGLHFITMELVKGRTLADMLPAKGFALGKFFELAIPLADAVAAAHQQGITHRDLKPGNVMIGEDGRVKVLDFGLAKMTFEFGSPSDGQLPTQSATHEGHIIGTPAYMSPEQAEGKRVDARSDIFSLGIIFYEMLTGERPFAGEAAASLLSILRDTPRPVIELRPAIPRQLARLVHRCLAKDPIERYQSAIDLRHDLEEAKQDLESGDLVASHSPGPASRRTMRSTLGLVTATIAALSVGFWLFSGGEAPRVGIARLENPVQVTSAWGVESYPTWSPDGLRLAYQAVDAGYFLAGNHDIWIAQPGSGDPVNLTRDSTANDRMPSWSPDGRELAFFSDRDGSWGVYIVAAIGGTARNVLSLPGTTMVSSNSAPQWSQDGNRLFVLSSRQGDENVVIVLSLESLESSRVVLPGHDGNFCWDLSPSPDDRRFAYVEAGGGGPEVSRLWTIPVSGGEAVPLTDGRTNVWNPTWSRDGRTIFYVSNRGGSMDLWQQTVGDDGQPVGEALAITQGLGISSAAFSRDATRVAYSRGGRVGNVWRVPILSDRPATWADAVQVTSEHAYIEFVDVSPDGATLAVSSDRRGNQDLWLLPAGGGEMTPLTTDPTPDWNPRWSPNGQEIAFYSYRSGNRDIWAMSSRGGPARRLSSHPGQDWYPSWSPDGREIAFQSRGRAAIMIVGAEGGEPRALEGAGDGIPEWSLDKTWLVVRKQTGLYRVATASGEAVPLPIKGVQQAFTPRVSRDGQSIFYSIITGQPDTHGFWRLSLADGAVSRLTRLEGRRGNIGDNFSTDGRYLYFTWREDDGDIWVMDVVTRD